jgi:hypothetical protein
MHHCNYNERDLKNLNEIYKFLNENNIEYSTEYNNFCLNFGNPNGVRSYEICYVSSESFPIENKKLDIDGVKSDYFYKKSFNAENENNSFICWVKDYEWEDDRKREVLKSYWLYAAGKINKKFYARETEVREVKSDEARKFESEHCFYGKRGASLNLGLYTKKDKYGIPKGTLIMIYTFGKNFFGRDNSIEIIRVGTMEQCLVTGGASKLLNYFIDNYKNIKIGKNIIKVEKLKFYSDYDHNIGLSLEKLGFKFKEYSGGGFMNLWLETGEIKHRDPKNHKIILDKMKNNLIIAVPNSGVKTYEFDIL